MNIFTKIFPLAGATQDGLEPNYIHGDAEVDIDLQIKSLLYIFKRYRIDQLGPFSERPQPEDDPSQAKLDRVYNVSAFERQVWSDEHRILVDWTKNKFRSLCLLSEGPKKITQLPALRGSKYRFEVLSCNASEIEMIDILVGSPLYLEHPVSIALKLHLARSIVQKYSGRPISKNVRAAIILEYLQKLAETVQIDRIYKATGTAVIPQPMSRSPSPVKRTSSPVKGLRTKKSMTILRLDSSVQTDQDSEINRTDERYKAAENAVYQRMERERKAIARDLHRM